MKDENEETVDPSFESQSKTKAVAVMIQGTASDVGKSTIVAGLLRIAKRRGLLVAPFKPQNMSNNAHACSQGEIGRAQATQARAAGVEPCVDFNPILLKPQSNNTCQVLVHGQPLSNNLEAKEYIKSTRDGLLTPVLESFERLMSQYDMIIVEGAGSPSEVNLRSRDISNMGFARRAGVPVCLVGDIEKGGVIASIVGTKTVLDPEDAAMIVGCIVNKFHGDISLFDEGVHEIEKQTGWPCFGVVPFLKATSKLPPEDAVTMHNSAIDDTSKDSSSVVRIAAPKLSRIANFDDADPLRLDPNVHFEWIPPGKPIPRNVDAIVLFGTKSALGELDFVRQQGWHHDIMAHARTGGHVFGLCGGYQMLGKSVVDHCGVDGDKGEQCGLGLLDIKTVLGSTKMVGQVSGHCALSKEPISGYEIHVGQTTGPDTERPMLQLSNGPDGARSLDGRIEGCYVHGLFANDAYRSAWLNCIKDGAGDGNYLHEASVEAALDELADGLEASLDIDAIFACARPAGWQTNDTKCSNVND